MISTTYKITLVTRTVASTITNVNIYITLYGEQGNSGEIYFGNAANNLAQENVDVLTINSQQIGNISKIRVRYGNGHKPGLVLTSVLLDEEKTGKEWVCSRNRWLADDKEDSSLVRELRCSKV